MSVIELPLKHFRARTARANASEIDRTGGLYGFGVMAWHTQRRILPPQKQMTITTQRLWEDQYVLAWRIYYLVVVLAVAL